MQHIKSFDTSRSTWGHRQVLMVIPTLFLVACAADLSEPMGDQDSLDKNTTIRRSELPAPEAASEKAGCTHIRFCDQPNSSNEVVCDTNDSPCSNSARLNECVSDADAVCGTDWGVITLDPPVGTIVFIINGR